MIMLTKLAGRIVTDAITHGESCISQRVRLECLKYKYWPLCCTPGPSSNSSSQYLQLPLQTDTTKSNWHHEVYRIYSGRYHQRYHGRCYPSWTARAPMYQQWQLVFTYLDMIHLLNNTVSCTLPGGNGQCCSGYCHGMLLCHRVSV